MNTFQLDVYKSDWGLPSIDTNCLQVLAYAKFTGIPIKVNTCGNPFKTPHGRLPLLRYGAQTWDTVKDIIEVFRQNNYNADCSLSFNQCALVLAYDALLKEQLLPAMQYMWWIDKKNVDEFVRPLYSRALPFPIKFYYLSCFERYAHTFLSALYPLENDATSVEKEVYSEAQECIKLLSTRLGDSQYFFGDQPSTLDAIIYSYLAPLLNAPLPNKALQNYLNTHTNLTDYVKRISKKYFSREESEYRQHIAEENQKKIRRDLDVSFPNKRRNQILAGLFASFAMAFYALTTGIVEVSIQDDEADASEDYMLKDEDTE